MRACNIRVEGHRSFYLACSLHIMQRFPDKEVPALRPAMLHLYESGLALARKILEMMEHALKLEVRSELPYSSLFSRTKIFAFRAC